MTQNTDVGVRTVKHCIHKPTFQPHDRYAPHFVSGFIKYCGISADYQTQFEYKFDT